MTLIGTKFVSQALAQQPAIARDKPEPELPPGAIARLGISRLPKGSPIVFSQDGKSFVALDQYRNSIVRYGADTGKELVRRAVPGDAKAAHLYSDGQHLQVRTETEIQVRDIALDRVVLKRPVPENFLWADTTQSGQELIVAKDHSIVGWNLGTGTERLLVDKVPNLDECEHYLAGNGKRLILYSRVENVMRCYDLKLGSIEWQKNGLFLAISLTTNGSVAVAYDYTGKKWVAIDLATGKPADDFKLPKQDRHSMSAIAPDGRTFIVATKDGLLLWDMKEARELRRISGTESAWATDWRLLGPFSPDGKSFLTNFDGLQRYELETGRPLLPDTTALGHTWPVEAIAFSGDGKLLASARDNVRVWNIATRRLVHTFRGQIEDVPKVLFTPDCTRLAATGAHGTVRIWDVASGKQLHLFQLEGQRKGGERPRIGAVQLSLDGQQVTAAANAFNAGKQVCILGTWNITNGEELVDRINPYGAGILAWRLQLSKGGELLNKNGDLLSPDGGNSLNPRPRIDAGESIASSTEPSLSADGRLAVAVIQPKGRPTEFRELVVWEVASGGIITRVRVKRDGYVRYLLGQKKPFLFTASVSGVQTWDLRTGLAARAVGTEEGSRMGVCCIGHDIGFAVSSDGRVAATAHDDGTILLWDVATPEAATAPWNQAEAPGLWADLANPDAAKGFAAVARFLDHPPEALAFLQQHLRPAAPPPLDEVKKLLGDLDSTAFNTREAASKKLLEFGERIEGMLQDALKANPTPEARKRINAILESLAPTVPPQPEALRNIRAVWVLERIGTPQAKKLLEELAKGYEFASLTGEAKAALERLP